MIAISKRITILLSILVCIELIVFGSLVFADYSVAAQGIEKIVMEASDVSYIPPVKEDNKKKKKEAIDETIALSKDVGVEIGVAAEDSPVELEEEQFNQEADDYGQADDYDQIDNPSYAGDDYVDANVDGNWISSDDFMYNGVCYDDSGYSYTYYSENVLPGGGLDIPGRHVDDEGYVVDGDGNLCVASDDLPYGTVVNVPFGTGTAVVYDSGSGYGNLDVYTSW